MSAPTNQPPYKMCSEHGCLGRVEARGLCEKHYRRGYRDGKLPRRQKRPRKQLHGWIHESMDTELCRIIKERNVKKSLLVRKLLAYALKHVDAALEPTPTTE